MMKTIFLDIDGVLNSVRFYRERKLRGKRREVDSDEICPLHVAQLNRILEATGAQVVLSSTWRKFTPLPEMAEILRSKGCVLKEFSGATPVGETKMESGLW